MLLLLALLGSACSSRPGYALAVRNEDELRIPDASYYDALEDVTRYDAYFSGLTQRFFVVATWESWSFRQRRAQVTSQFLQLQSEDAAQVLAREREAASRYVDLVVGLHTDEARWNDLSSPTSIWRLLLRYPDGTTVAPVSIERIGRPDANVRALYPYLQPFVVGYRVRFPAAVEGAALGKAQGDLVLMLSSAVGYASPTWRVGPGAVPETVSTEPAIGNAPVEETRIERTRAAPPSPVAEPPPPGPAVGP